MRKLQIVNALLWATSILVSAYYFRGEAGYNYLLGTQVVAATLMLGLIHTASKKASL